MKVGLSKEEIELLGREGHNVTKVSRRDLPFVVAAGKNGATTVGFNDDYCGACRN
ncbi:indigoidine synthase A like protein [Escherichia coli]|uniref:Indigoidine synthase A like protein n=1 Tax=Escherichia coli TaxID=562 RepID=A0A377BSU9_ECOLX|nr:indigoidine synthase A like protein [Escherichia coli]